MPSKILFVLKKREMTLDENNTLTTEIRPGFGYCVSSGLRNSATFVVDMLNENGIESKLVEVVDNNAIDREVVAFKPSHVVIEAFWVVPEKFEVLTRLHPKVKWIVRNHSEMPFLANDGIALDWTLKYMKCKNVYIAPNSPKTQRDTYQLVKASAGEDIAKERVLYLPNYYVIKEQPVKRRKLGDTIDVGCFGAIRPFKNHLVQAIAAISFAQKYKKNLRFHVNVARIENQGNNVLRNLRGLFDNLGDQYQLVEHGWLNHDEFLRLVETMDIGLQASFTESFNIVAADFVSRGVPIVVSKEIDWVPSTFWAAETDSEDIVKAMERALGGFIQWFKAHYALNSLERYNNRSRRIWLEVFE